MRHESTREKLASIEGRIRDLRAERARAKNVVDAAKAAAAASRTNESLAAGKGALDALAAVDAEIEQATEEQVMLLRKLGDREQGVAGFASPGLDGWNEAAEALSVSEGQLRADVRAATVLRSVSSGSSRSRTTPVPASSNRFLYPVLDQQPFGSESGDFSATDFTVTFSQSALTGVERAVDATTPKAKLTPNTQLATVTAKLHAVVLDNQPSRIFDTQEPLRALLSTEMQRQLDLDIDRHLVSAITAANPPNGSTGTGLVAQIRNAIASMVAVGGEPRYLALSPSQAASLDLTVDDSGAYVFDVQREGSSVPIWSLLVREAPTVTDPLLIDPERLGLVYVGDASLLLDPFSGMANNLTSARLEIEATAHIRNATQGAWRIG